MEAGRLGLRTAEGLLEGEIPLDTGKEVNKSLHRVVMDGYLDDRIARRTVEKAKVDSLMRSVKAITGEDGEEKEKPGN